MSAVQSFEGTAFRRMLEAGKLPHPETDSDAFALRRAGVKLKGGELLQSARLPEGWTAVQTEDRWGELFDEQGRVRANFFYKVQDYRGFLQMKNRYTTWCGRPGNDNWCAWDMATDIVLFESGSTNRDVAYREVQVWLNQHYPNWQDPSRYWNDTEVSRPWWRFWG